MAPKTLVDIAPHGTPHVYFVAFVARGADPDPDAFIATWRDPPSGQAPQRKAFGVFHSNGRQYAEVPNAFVEQALTDPASTVLTIRTDGAGYVEQDLLRVEFYHYAPAELFKVIVNDVSLNPTGAPLTDQTLAQYVAGLVDAATKGYDLTLPDGSYHGQAFGGKPNGTGAYKFQNGAVVTATFLLGRAWGHGVAVFKSGDRWDGRFYDDEQVAPGTLHYVNGDLLVSAFGNGQVKCTYTRANGDVFEGDANPRYTARGTIHYANGDVYQGDVWGLQRSGIGKLTRRDGSVSDGIWENDQYSGAAGGGDGPIVLDIQRTWIFTNGTYEGAMAGDQPEGQGTFRNNNGDVYTGSFKAGLFDGSGRYTWTNGTVFEGQFARGKRNGPGRFTGHDGSQVSGTQQNDTWVGPVTATFANHDTCVGMMVNGQFNGLARYAWASGAYYDGNFAHGQPDGDGTRVFDDGTRFNGSFRDGRADRGTWYRADGQEIGTQQSRDSPTVDEEDGVHMEMGGSGTTMQGGDRPADDDRVGGGGGE